MCISRGDSASGLAIRRALTRERALCALVPQKVRSRHATSNFGRPRYNRHGRGPVRAAGMEGNVSPVEISNCSGASRPDLKEINALLATSFRGAVAARVRDAQREGDVAADLDPDAVAEFLMANIAGIRIAGRGGADRASLTSLADMALTALR